MGIIAIALIVADGFWFYKRYLEPNATITYLGLDSGSFVVPSKQRAAKWRNDDWDVDPAIASGFLHEKSASNAERRTTAYITLAPESTFGAALAAIRNLKGRKICNVLIRDAGQLYRDRVDFPEGPDYPLEIPAIVLCGDADGDAGFSGKLPSDGPIRIE